MLAVALLTAAYGLSRLKSTLISQWKSIPLWSLTYSIVIIELFVHPFRNTNLYLEADELSVAVISASANSSVTTTREQNSFTTKFNLSIEKFNSIKKLSIRLEEKLFACWYSVNVTEQRCRTLNDDIDRVVFAHHFRYIVINTILLL